MSKRATGLIYMSEAALSGRLYPLRAPLKRFCGIDVDKDLAPGHMRVELPDGTKITFSIGQVST